jgi:hypothetical protein
MTAALTLVAPPVNPTDAAAKSYVDTKLPLAGGTLTGNLTFSYGNPTVVLNSQASGQNHSITGSVNGLNRWSINLGNATAESGSNAGSDFDIYNCNDAGAIIGTALRINRANSTATFAGGIYTSGLTIDPSTGNAALALIGPGANGASDIYGQKAVGVGRWLMRLGDGGTESGGNVGSNFVIYNYADNGTTILGVPLAIQRATGQVAIGVAQGGGFSGGSYAGQASMSMGSTYGFVFSAQRNSAGGGSIPHVFLNTSGASVGNIIIGDSGTSYNTASDVRLKENIASFTNGREIIDRLQVRSFDWRETHQRGIGVIAQEAIEVYPDAVSDDRGPGEGFQPMGIDYSKFVPLLIEALQDAHRRIDALERK